MSLASGGEPALTLDRVSKTFGGARALDEVALTLARGEIRALVGKNGSGKSTLIKILSGFHSPDAGASLAVRGRRFSLPASVDEVRAAGLSFVHQDLALIPDATVLENVLVGRFADVGIRPIRWRREAERVRRALARFDFDLPLDAQVRRLSPVERAFVAIARGFIDADTKPGVLVLDEPTAFLPQDEVGRLFGAIRALAAEGEAILYVSHRLDEVLDLAQTVTVLRDGRSVFEGETKGLSEEALVRQILGADVQSFYPALASPRETIALAVEGLSGAGVRDISLSLRRGEILGVSGLAGAGHEALPYLLTGAVAATAGELRAGGRTLDARKLSPTLTREIGFALLPADRQRTSGAQMLSLRENLSLPVLSSFFHHGFLNRRQEQAEASKWLQDFGVRPAAPEALLRTLSGGNQQKALLAKWMQTNPEVLLLHEPTQGVDVGAKQDIFRKLEDFAERGVGVLIASAESEDLARLCHRVLTLRNGRVVGELSGPALSEHAINDLAFRDAPRASERESAA